jgi:YD repeat-containing protein
MGHRFAVVMFGLVLVAHLSLCSSVWAAVPQCPGDANGDLVVDVNDISYVLFRLGNAGVPGAVDGDVNGDGIVDVNDISFVLFRLGPCAQSAVEPGTREVPPGIPTGCVNDTYDTGFARPWREHEARLGENIFHFSGVAREEQADLLIEGRCLDLSWVRSYRSATGPNSPQGNGWDYSYNIFIEVSGADLIMHDGHTRSDLYALNGAGDWVSCEFFRVITQNPDTSYTCTFPDSGMWHFNPLNGSVDEGRVSSIEDRNGNTISFTYDGAGRLSQITDSLSRVTTIAYNADDLILNFTDFTSRQVTYDYYNNGDAGGSAGDLKSATSPTVTGTPTGNDYPSGKTTTYAYTTGFANDSLNHDLLTITDPKGQVYLTNEYAHTISALDPRFTITPGDLNFGRLMRQVIGDPGDTIDYFYDTVLPSPVNNGAVSVTVVNDRVGNVKELYYDLGNRLVVEREFTGRAPDPDALTSLTVNRPVSPVRVTDPAFFETRFEFNADSLVTRIVHPNLNEELFVYDTLNADRVSQGNILEYRLLPGVLGGAQAQIVDTFEYESGFGDPRASNFVTRHTDARGNDTLHTYDAGGNRLQTTGRIVSIVTDFQYNAFGQMIKRILPDNGSGCRRVDLFTYYVLGPQSGYLSTQVIDATDIDACAGAHFDITTSFEYDAVGNSVRVIDPRGNDTLVTYNELDQVVRVLSREESPGSARYEQLTYYDANGNVVREDIENRDETGALQVNTHLSTLRDYDILDYLIRECDEKGVANLNQTVLDCGSVPPGQFITNEYEYDANRNVTLHRSGESVNGNQPDNTVTRTYDERDLVFELFDADGSPDQSSCRFDYDGNGNLTTAYRGLEADASPSYAGDMSHVTLTVYDGYNRAVTITDPMGNRTSFEYDANHNTTNSRIDGEEVDVAGDAGNTRLYERTDVFDAMDRCTQRHAEHYDIGTQLPIGDGLRSGTFIWSDRSRVTSATDDNLNACLSTYDSANRLRLTSDANGNITRYNYDQNSNVVFLRENDQSDLGAPVQLFVTLSTYDQLDRLIDTTDSSGNVTSYEYDSRYNVTREIDPRGNVRRNIFDSIDRLTSSEYDLTDTGDGAGIVIGTITNSYTYDDNNRVTSATDSNSHATLHSYDALDRLTSTEYADTTTHSYTYDVHHNIVDSTDANNTAISHIYDLKDRLTDKAITPGVGVASTTLFERFEYDGVGRVRDAENDLSVVTMLYDSLSNCVEETLVVGGAPIHTSVSTFDGQGNRLSCTYPSGRTVDRSFDQLNRIRSVQDSGSPLADYEYIGLRIEQVRHGNGTQSDYAYDGFGANPPGDFGVQQCVGLTHSDGVTPFDNRSYTWDQAGNRTSQDETISTENRGHLYDSVNRLGSTFVFKPTGLVRDTTYTLDDVGNRLFVSGDSASGAYVMDPTSPVPDDAAVNQYTATPTDDVTYDENGVVESRVSKTTGALTAYSYDYLDRLVDATDTSTLDNSSLEYDALGRRIRWLTTTATGSSDTRFYYCGSDMVEERDGSDTTTTTHVMGDASGLQSALNDYPVFNSSTPGGDIYLHQDDQGSTVKVTDGVGAVIESIDYGDYGERRIALGEQSPDQAAAFPSDADAASQGGFTTETAESMPLFPSLPLTGLRVWGGYSGAIPGNDSFAVTVYDSTGPGGSPGSAIYQESAIAHAGRVLTGQILAAVIQEQVFEIRFNQPFNAPAPGIFWISVQNNTSLSPGSVWQWGSASTGDGLRSSRVNVGLWNVVGGDLAFQAVTDTAQSGNSYGHHGLWYDEVSDTYMNDAGRHTKHQDPHTGRTICPGPNDKFGNKRTSRNNNPTSYSRARKCALWKRSLTKRKYHKRCRKMPRRYTRCHTTWVRKRPHRRVPQNFMKHGLIRGDAGGPSAGEAKKKAERAKRMKRHRRMRELRLKLKPPHMAIMGLPPKADPPRGGGEAHKRWKKWQKHRKNRRPRFRPFVPFEPKYPDDDGRASDMDLQGYKEYLEGFNIQDQQFAEELAEAMAEQGWTYDDADYEPYLTDFEQELADAMSEQGWDGELSEEEQYQADFEQELNDALIEQGWTD